VLPIFSGRTRRFAPALRRIASELPLPDGLRSAVLAEIAADLESLYDHYRSSGHDEDSAIRLAEERLLVAREAMGALGRVHTTAMQRWAWRSAERLRHGLDLVLLTLGVGPMLLLAGLVAATRMGGMLAFPLFWPLAAMGTFAAMVSLRAVWLLIGRRSGERAELERDMTVLAGLAAGAPMLGLTFSLIDAYGGLTGPLAGSAAEATALAMAEWMARSATLLAMGLLIGISSALVWAVLAGRVAILRRMETDALLAL
jgi:hypothetical protein